MKALYIAIIILVTASCSSTKGVGFNFTDKEQAEIFNNKDAGGKAQKLSVAQMIQNIQHKHGISGVIIKFD